MLGLDWGPAQGCSGRGLPTHLCYNQSLRSHVQLARPLRGGGAQLHNLPAWSSAPFPAAKATRGVQDGIQGAGQDSVGRALRSRRPL